MLAAVRVLMSPDGGCGIKQLGLQLTGLDEMVNSLLDRVISLV